MYETQSPCGEGKMKCFLSRRKFTGCVPLSTASLFNFNKGSGILLLEIHLNIVIIIIKPRSERCVKERSGEISPLERSFFIDKKVCCLK